MENKLKLDLNCSSAQEHTFAPYIRALGKGKQGSRSLDMNEAKLAMTSILNGTADPLQIGAFLMLLRVKEESSQELAGFVSACKEHIAAPKLAVDLDWSSYAGKKKHLPWFILSALALSDSGIKVFMHGTGGHTAGRLYTETALNALGINSAYSWQDAQNQLSQSNFSFMPLSVMSPKLEELIHLKPILGLRSVVNTMARLINPCDAPASLHSIFHPAYASKHVEAAQALNYSNMLVFKGDGGEIERRPEAHTALSGLKQNNEYELSWPKLLEGKQVEEDVSDLTPLLTLWTEDTVNKEAYGYTAVVGTLAIALMSLNQFDNADQAYAAALKLWEGRNRDRLTQD
jgi:anthranilate phosphoribosyltransferase